jgi:oligosaccharyltransferase complex subunit alpha (ribophorin I)
MFLHRLPFLLLAALVSPSIASSAPFENSAIVRTIELSGSLVHVTTTYAIKALQSGQKTYTIALSSSERERTSWLEATIKGQNAKLPIEESELDHNLPYHLVDVKLPKALAVNATLQIVLEAVQTHATKPWPERASQKEEQALKFTTDVFVLSPYSTSVQRTKLRTLQPRIISFTEPKGISEFTSDAPATKSGATITYGPYNNIPPCANEDFISAYQQPVTVHYYHDQPVIELLSYNRSLEISHWGANLNTEDQIHLYNAGPALKGHFSRLEHQMQGFYHKASPHTLQMLSLDLPPGVSNVYYYDIIGNVSTSRLQAAPSVPKGTPGIRRSTLEMRPRYPVLGGWNYTFTLGWDTPLGDSVGWDAKTGKYVAELPIITMFPGVVIDNAQVSIVLPEGATEIDFVTPYSAIETQVSTHITYLDTIGRPKLTFTYKNLTPKHAANIYVTYKVSLSAHLRKPTAVAVGFFSLFAITMILRRIELTIDSKKKKQ